MVTGTIRASGINLNSVINPPVANSFGMPFLLRVPSGKITTERLVLFKVFVKSLIASIDCLLSFRSIKADPPFLKL